MQKLIGNVKTPSSSSTTTNQNHFGVKVTQHLSIPGFLEE